MKKYLPLAVLILITVQGHDLCGQMFKNIDNYVSEYYFKHIFFINENEFVVRNGEEVIRFDLSKDEPFQERYRFDSKWIYNLLYLDHNILINHSGVYHHNYFKEFKKISDLKIELSNKKSKEEFVHQKFVFYKPKKTFVLADSKKKIVYLLNAENGNVESMKVNIDSGDEIFPVNADYLYIRKKYNKKKRMRDYLIYHLRSNTEIQTIGLSYILAVSDTLAFVYESKYKFINLKTGELYDWVNSLTNPNIQCCHHYLSQNGRYIISVGTALTFSVYDIQKRKIMTSSEYNNRSNIWNVYDNRLKNVLPADMYYSIYDIEISPDGSKYVFSEQNGWVLVTTTGDFKKIMQYGKYRINESRSNRQQAQSSTPQSSRPTPVYSGVKELNLSFQSEYRYQWFNNTSNYKDMQVKIEVTPTTIQEYIWGRGAYVIWGGPCTIVHSKNETIDGKPGLLYVCSGGKIYFFYSDKGVSAVRVIESSGHSFDYISHLP